MLDRHIDQNGYLTAGNVPGTYEVFAQGVGTNIRVGMYYEIARSVKNIEIVNIPAYVYAGQSHTFTVIGYDQRGRRMHFSPRWSAQGGHITQNGIYTAGHLPGNYQIIVSDGYGVEHSISIVVKKDNTRHACLIARYLKNCTNQPVVSSGLAN